MILQTHLPHDVTASHRLPGTRPLGDAPWLIADEAFGAQMAERARLLAEARDRIIVLDACARPAAEELLDTVLLNLPDGYFRGAGTVTRPDGVTVTADRADPMGTLCQLVQEDMVIMERRGGDDEHVLTAAVLCFPARWVLTEKFLRPLTVIHEPVPDYDDSVATRVQRLFDGLQAGRPIWRSNALWDMDPTLHQPVRPAQRPKCAHRSAPYFRTERQVLMRLPGTRAVAFSIHTYVLRREDLPGEMSQTPTS